jgi:hypothetical protein
MKISKLRIAIATAAVAVSVSAVAPSAFALTPKPVKVGSSGNAQLDDICRQMGDLINDEIAEGNNAESNHDYGSANAWWSQASEHISRAQSAGCVMSIKAPKGNRYSGSFSAATAGQYTPKSRTDKSGNGGTIRSAKRIVGSGGGGKGQFTTQSCGDLGNAVTSAVANSTQAAQNGDTGLAAGWRQHANDLLAAGRNGGCTFTAV